MELYNLEEFPKQEFCLRWKHYGANLVTTMEHLLETKTFVDCTLACDGFSLNVHKVVLSACSPYFQSLLLQNPCDHPIIILRDLHAFHLKLLVQFMYTGEMCAADDQIPALLQIAESLKIRGLASNESHKSMFDSPTDIEGCALKDPQKRKHHDHDYVIATKVMRLSTEHEQQHADCNSLSVNDTSTVSQPIKNKFNLPTTSPIDLSNSSYVNGEPLLAEPHKESQQETKLTKNFDLFEDTKFSVKFNSPTWTQSQLQEAINAVVTQRMKFSQASGSYSIPKATLYDNILGKSKRMLVLDEAQLSAEEERSVLEFCCKETAWSYKRRTRLSLPVIIEFVEKLRRSRHPEFAFTGLAGFRWWWAFCKKNSISSTYTNCGSYDYNKENDVDTADKDGCPQSD